MTDNTEKRKPKGKIRSDSREAPSARTGAGREKQLTNLAMDLAEKQLREGTATSQVITHFLKLGSETDLLQRDKLRNENKLLEAKVEQIAAQTRIEEMYLEATEAMKKYTGSADEYDVGDFYDEDY